MLSSIYWLKKFDASHISVVLMILMLAAVNKYQRKVSNCIEVANEVMAEQTRIGAVLELYNLQVLSVKASVQRIASARPEPQCMEEELFALEQSARELNDAVETARFSAIGRLGLAFDELRAAFDSLHELMPHDLEEAMPTLVMCHQDIDDICTRLVESCIVDVESLRAMGIPAL